MRATRRSEVPGNNKTILLLVTQSERGGAQLALCRLAYGLRTIGHDVEAWCLYVKNTRARFNDIELRGPDWGTRGVIGKFASITLVYSRILLHTAIGRYDYVIAFTHYSILLSMILRLVNPNIRIIASHRNPQYSYSRLTRFALRILSAIAPADNIVMVSSHVGQTFSRRETGRSKVCVIRNEVDTSPNHLHQIHNQNQSATQAASDNRFILSVGRLDIQKRQDILIKALPNLPESVYLILVGDGPKRGEYEELSKQLGVSKRVIFKGAIPRSDVMELMMKCSVFCLTSSFEGMSNALNEAISIGCPIAVRSVKSIAEAVKLLDGRTCAYRVGPDHRQWASAISELLTNETLRIQLARRALARKAELCSHNMTNDFHRLLYFKDSNAG